VMITWQLMEGTLPDNRWQDFPRINPGPQGMPRAETVPVIALSQLSRGGESRTIQARCSAICVNQARSKQGRPPLC